MCYQVLQQLDAAQGSVEDMDEWLGIFNVKLRHMREDIESVQFHQNPNASYVPHILVYWYNDMDYIFMKVVTSGVALADRSKEQ